MENINKLPKWAQSKIIVLERKIDNLQAELRQIYGSEETNISFSKGIGDEFNLPKNVRVIFKLKSHRRFWVDCFVTSEGKLRISGDAQLSILPSASNCFIVESRYSGKED